MIDNQTNRTRRTYKESVRLHNRNIVTSSPYSILTSGSIQNVPKVVPYYIRVFDNYTPFAPTHEDDASMDLWYTFGLK
jgi:hypothetical protein